MSRMDGCQRFVSLYSGAGGLDLGFISAGFEPLWANDFDSDAVATYRANIGPHAIAGDINEVIDLNHLATLAPDLVIGGPPCQGFSVAGHMRPDDPRSQHVWRFLEIVAALSPRAFVMENVAALAVNPRWATLIGDLKESAGDLGFNVRSFVLDASHYGVPQARQRMFLVGIKDSDPLGPAPITDQDLPTVRGAFKALPAYGQPGNDSLCVARVTPARRPVLRRSPFAGMLFNGKGRALNLDSPAATLPASMGGNRTPIVDQWQLEGRAEECWIVGYHARLMAGRRPNKRIPRRMRRLTVEEAAALQTFPPSWKFAGRRGAQFRQIGNAVPPELAYHVACALRESMAAKKPDDSEEIAPLAFAA